MCKTLITVFLILGVIVVFLSHFVTETEHERLPKAYKAWVKVTGKNDISFEEWTTLYYTGTLPNITKP